MDLQLEAYEGLGLVQPAEWSPSDREGQWEEPACSAQDSLLADDSVSGYSLGLSSSPTASEGSDHFPCIADELEEQAKQLEEGWFCPSQPPAAAAALAKGQQAFRLRSAHLAAPALRHSGLDRLQRQLAQLEQQQRRQQQQSADGQIELERPASRSGAAGEEPCTPQRQSKDSSWNESPLPGCGGDGSSRGGGMDFGEVQSPAPAKLMSLSPAAAADRRPPLLLAIDNAQRVRLGQEPAAAGAWRGCASGAWCSREARHCGPCDADASVPSLLAYPAEELFESGVNLEELCHLPQQLAEATASPLAPETDSEGGEGAAAADCLSSGKRRADTEADADAEADDGASHSQSGMRASSGSPAAAAAAAAGEEEQQSGGSSHAAKRPRSIAVPSIPALAAAAAELTLSAPALPADSSSRGLQAADGFVPVCAGMIPVSVPQFAPPVPPLPGCSAASRNRGRPAGAPRLRAIARTAAPEPTAAPAAAATAVTITPNKPVTRQQPRTPDSAAATVAPRPSGRKAVLQWHTESVTDPRTGATVTEVEPGTFCTQCFALSTPVWRAGPFGVKSLCNACGVRWMKASKSTKK